MLKTLNIEISCNKINYKDFKIILLKSCNKVNFFLIFHDKETELHCVEVSKRYLH